MDDTNERFVNLEKFLTRNESVKTLMMSDCRLSTAMITQMGLGLSQNHTLERLVLQSNEIADKQTLNHIVNGLLDN